MGVKESEKSRILQDPGSGLPGSCMGRCRRSPHSVTALCFFVVFLDAMLLTALEPILADIVRHTDGIPEFLQDLQEYTQLVNNTAVVYTSSRTSSLSVGIVFSAKPFTELFANPFGGCIVDRFQYETPMYIGFILSIVATLGLAYSRTYLFLVLTRCIQGIGNVLLVISALSFASFIHGNTPERSSAFAIIFIGTGLGSLVGFPYGGFVYEYLGRPYPYLILSILLVCALGFKLWCKPETNNKLVPQHGGVSSYFKMFKDVYVVCAVIGWINAMFSVSGMLLSVPLIAYDKFGSGPSRVGLVFLCSGMVQAVVQAALARHTQRIGWWKLCFAGGCLIPVVLLMTTLVNTFWMFLLPIVTSGFAIALFMSSFHAMLCHTADIRVGPTYGATFSFNKIGYGIGTFSGSMAFSGLIDVVGYNNTLYIASAITFLVNFVILVQRDVPNIQELDKNNEARLDSK